MTPERAIEILRTARPCGTPNTITGQHTHDTWCHAITGHYTATEARLLADHGLAAQNAAGTALYATEKGHRAVAQADA